MNKKEFTKLLERKLKILDENEVKDIINEYKDTIDEKVKHGQSEEDAVKDFGDIDELAKEILKAYKVNPKYDEIDEELINVKEMAGDFEDWVKRSSKKMAQVSKGLYNDFKNSNLTVELIFEILIKIIVLLILLAILRLPFELINSLGESILDFAFYPLNELLMFIWKIIVCLLYFVASILISITMFKDYFKNVENENKAQQAKPKKVIKKEKAQIKEEKIISDVKTEKVDNKDSNIIIKTLKIIFQVFVVISFIMPLSLIVIGIVVLLVLGIYYLCIGINTVGVILILIGLFIFFTHIIDIIHSIAFKHKKIQFYPFLLSIIFLATGFVLIIHFVLNIEYSKEIPNNKFNKNYNEYEFKIEKETIIDADEIEYIVDNSIEDNNIRVEVEYYPTFTNVGYYEKNNGKNYDYINLYLIGNFEYNSGLDLYNLVIDNLKNNKIYDYELLFESNTKIYASEMTMNLIKKD